MEEQYLRDNVNDIIDIETVILNTDLLVVYTFSNGVTVTTDGQYFWNIEFNRKAA